MVAVGVALVAFALYHATLLPGLDFGDTAAFQDAGGALDVTPRQGYPLYFALGNLVVWAVGGEPAYGMNLASAIAGALACGVLTWLAIRLLRSTLGGLFTGVLFAGSYTFWSQAIIAEVYALHLLMLALSLLTLLWWSERPASLARLALFFSVYALGYGNHLMMVLLLGPATLFLAVSMPRGIRDLVAPRVLALAIGIAALGSLQYLWNLRFLYALPYPPASLTEALQTFWFDVTKSDWRATMIAGIDKSAYPRRVGMYRFDLCSNSGYRERDSPSSVLRGSGYEAGGRGCCSPLAGSWRRGLRIPTTWATRTSSSCRHTCSSRCSRARASPRSRRCPTGSACAGHLR